MYEYKFQGPPGKGAVARTLPAGTHYAVFAKSRVAGEWTMLNVIGSEQDAKSYADCAGKQLCLFDGKPDYEEFYIAKGTRSDSLGVYGGGNQRNE